MEVLLQPEDSRIVDEVVENEDPLERKFLQSCIIHWKLMLVNNTCFKDGPVNGSVLLISVI